MSRERNSLSVLQAPEPTDPDEAARLQALIECIVPYGKHDHRDAGNEASAGLAQCVE